MSHPEYDLCVIGGGSGGLVVAAGGAAMGAKVILIEKNRLGGDCLYTGCVPSKALIHSARVAHTIRHAACFGVGAPAPAIELAAVMDYVASRIAAIEPHDSPERFRSLGVEVMFGEGQFKHPFLFRVQDRDIHARIYVIATGSRPLIPSIPGLSETPYFTNETIFDLREQVAALLILGAGPIGTEMAQAFNRLGSQVTLLTRGPRILPNEDPEMSAVVNEVLSREGVKILTDVDVQSAQKYTAGLQLTVASTSGQRASVSGSHLLIATGRQPNLAGLGLDEAGVDYGKGGISTDDRLRTSQPHIYACGDVVGPLRFTHLAEHQAGVVLKNALLHLRARISPVVPWCTFTDPELARVGMTQEDAERQHIEHRVWRFPFDHVDRALIEGDPEGMAKVVTSSSGKILGATIVGPHAGELIHEFTLAMQKKATLGDIAEMVHVYPTLSQINRRIGDQALKARLTPRIRKWMKILLRLRGK